MLEELKRYNSIGNTEGINLIECVIFDKNIESLETIYSVYSANTGVELNIKAAVLFYSDIELIILNNNHIKKTENGINISRLDSDERRIKITKYCFEHLLSNNAINIKGVHYDISNESIFIEMNAISLFAAIYRNYLISIGALKIFGDKYLIDNKYNIMFEKLFKEKNKKITLQQLLKQLEYQQQIGDKAELFVINYETKRLNLYGKKPKRISEIDVAAGYDIISYNNDASDEYDRFIEVKAVSNSFEFYWSKNEYDISKMLGDNYFLYLVEIKKINEANYQPQIICNPYKIIMNSDNWIVQSESYKIKKF